jgi:two-component system LytT family sensor kinase
MPNVSFASLGPPAAVAALVLVLAAAVITVLRGRASRGLATPAQRATYEVLHTASLAAPALRTGLTETAAAKSVRHLQSLLGCTALALTDTARVLAWEGPGDHHRSHVAAAVTDAVANGRVTALDESQLPCDVVDCPIRGAVVVPLEAEDSHQVGALVALVGVEPGPGLVRAAIEVASWASTQLALAELDASRARLAEAQVRALRAQISPHFIYNALSAIASFVRTDPERARELILEFADFTRYSFRSHGDYTTLADELGSIDRYLLIERARFGDRLQVRLQIAPEVLPVAVPFLCLQPLVENAVRHGLAGKPGVGTVSIVAEDAGADCLISVEDDGVGIEPSLLLRRTGTNGAADRANGEPGAGLVGNDTGQHVGLGNVDDRLRSVFGHEYGLVVETAPGAGTKVSMRVPKFHPGVRAAGVRAGRTS